MKALLVATNIERYANNDRLTGLWLSELTHFYDELVKAGIDCDVVSPEGGYVPLDPHSLQFMDDTDRHYYADKTFRNQVLGQSLSADQVKAEDYDIIYYSGGHGVMWDFPESKQLAKIAQAIDEKGGYVTAVCHGVAGLLPIQKADGTTFLTGRQVTGFANTEEDMNGTTPIVPFMTEDELRNKGAEVEIGPAYQPKVVVDGRLLTGQNPQSARLLGQTLIQTLKADGKL